MGRSEYAVRHRAATIPADLSDFIIKSVLENEAILIRGCRNRLILSNNIRKDTWENITAQIHQKFGIWMSTIQVQSHFNNRKRRVMASGVISEK